MERAAPAAGGAWGCWVGGGAGGREGATAGSGGRNGGRGRRLRAFVYVRGRRCAWRGDDGLIRLCGAAAAGGRELAGPWPAAARRHVGVVALMRRGAARAVHRAPPLADRRASLPCVPHQLIMCPISNRVAEDIVARGPVCRLQSPAVGFHHAHRPLPRPILGLTGAGACEW
jgi:hypothetical protein